MEVDDLKKITNTLTVLCSEKQKQEKVRVGLSLRDHRAPAFISYLLRVQGKEDEREKGDRAGDTWSCHSFPGKEGKTSGVGTMGSAGAVTAQSLSR